MGKWNCWVAKEVLILYCRRRRHLSSSSPSPHHHRSVNVSEAIDSHGRFDVLKHRFNLKLLPWYGERIVGFSMNISALQDGCFTVLTLNRSAAKRKKECSPHGAGLSRETSGNLPLSLQKTAPSRSPLTAAWGWRLGVVCGLQGEHGLTEVRPQIETFLKGTLHHYDRKNKSKGA